jgi:hypothetical protein
VPYPLSTADNTPLRSGEKAPQTSSTKGSGVEVANRCVHFPMCGYAAQPERAEREGERQVWSHGTRLGDWNFADGARSSSP